MMRIVFASLLFFSLCAFADSHYGSSGGGGGETIGDAVTGGTVKRVLYVGGGGLLAQSALLTFDDDTVDGNLYPRMQLGNNTTWYTNLYLVSSSGGSYSGRPGISFNRGAGDWEVGLSGGSVGNDFRFQAPSQDHPTVRFYDNTGQVFFGSSTPTGGYHGGAPTEMLTMFLPGATPVGIHLMNGATSDDVNLGTKFRMDAAGNTVVENTTPGLPVLIGATNAGVKWNTTGTKPTCASGTRGQVFVTYGAAGVADKKEICVKDAADAYAWGSF